ncbi:hypothetical protein AsAng_0037650 [Aureispira anguillae]|uniref:Uncharacterized protein n=1 Tax=Aureispira anguillae TaxID=2864201 RepID=A0A915YH23_9BACT|nr:hypothetical protein AsAng_0037650 [Aureispira anguillae]
MLFVYVYLLECWKNFKDISFPNKKIKKKREICKKWKSHKII